MCSIENRIAYKCINIAWGIATGLPVRVSCPEKFSATIAFLMLKPLVCEIIKLIFVIKEHVHQLVAEMI